MDIGRISGAPYKVQADAWPVENHGVTHNTSNFATSLSTAASPSLNASLQFGRQHIEAMSHLNLAKAAPAGAAPLQSSVPDAANNVSKNLTRLARAAVLHPLVPPLVKAPLLLGLGTLAVVDLINRFHPTPFSRAIDASPLLGPPSGSSGSKLVYPWHQDEHFVNPGRQSIDPDGVHTDGFKGRAREVKAFEWNLLPGNSLVGVDAQKLEGRQTLNVPQGDHLLLSVKANPRPVESANTKNIRTVSMGDTEEIKFYAEFDPQVKSDNDVTEAFGRMVDAKTKKLVGAYDVYSNEMVIDAPRTRLGSQDDAAVVEAMLNAVTNDHGLHPQVIELRLKGAASDVEAHPIVRKLQDMGYEMSRLDVVSGGSIVLVSKR